MFTENETETVSSGIDEVLRPDAAAHELKISIPVLMDLIKAGDLQAARVGRQWRIRRCWIYEYLDRAAAPA
ncbi:helix-turn-helix domain-containing protein [Mycobacteroides abscessus]|uniref:helix-turn-helix domain-containing protein n=1 Tax=Mycobacteroides abscessus TaxID=36809 RepID=UPI000E6A1B8E|nr:helix-turn-helix domain-containing protein [Mycobacteroides abscessus]RIS80456.1 DNA-binding protein [Mycobacteroides abscessus]